MALSATSTEQGLSAVLQDSLQRADDALLFVADVVDFCEAQQQPLPAAVLADVLLGALCGGDPCWMVAQVYLLHALAAGLIPAKYTLTALMKRASDLKAEKPRVFLACVHILEQYLPAMCLRREPAGPDIKEDRTDPLSVVDFLVSACTFLLGGVLRGAGAAQQPGLLGGPEQQDAVRAALRTLQSLLEGRQTGGLLRVARKVRPPAWAQLRGALEQLALAGAGLPWAEKQLADAVLAAWAALQAPPPALCGMVVAMQAAHDGWRPWTVGAAKAWLPLDVMLEDCAEGRRLPATTTAEALAGLLRVVRSVEGASWLDALLALWLAALRCVQRGHEEPFHTETRLSLLLAAVPMAIQAMLAPPPSAAPGLDPAAAFLADSSSDSPPPEAPPSPAPPDGATQQDLVASLDLLHQFPLLLPPPPAASAAAARLSPPLTGVPPPSPRTGSALGALSPLPSPAVTFPSGGPAAAPAEASAPSAPAGSLRDLIVDVCTARHLLPPSETDPPDPPPAEPPPGQWASGVGPWEQLMAGAPLTASLRAAILASPAHAQEQLERVYHIAVAGSDMDEQAAAASTLCGASLVRGWAIQEHAVRLSVQVLTPPRREEPHRPQSAGLTSPFRYLVHFAPMLFAALAALSQADTLEIVRLHGQLPHLAAALLPICDVFGDMPAGSPASADPAGDLLMYSIFSHAFLLLARILATFAPPSGAPASQGGLTLPALLDLAGAAPSPVLPVPSLAQFPRVAAWYRQHQGFSRPTPADAWQPRATEQLLRMLFPADRSAAAQPVLASAWDVIAAAPELGHALLAACASNRLPAKDLAQGLRSLLVYLPAAAVPLCRFFTAEVVRGAWPAAVLNGTEWPSPASRLPAMEADIAALLGQAAVGEPAQAGATPSAASWGNAVPALPLPLAAGLSLVLARTSDMSPAVASAVVVPLLRCAADQPWPTLAVVAALVGPTLRQGAKQLPPTAAALWCSSSVARIAKVLETCFRTALHPTLERPSGITSLLGESRLFGSRGPSALPPGAMYIRAVPHCSGGAAIASAIAAQVLAQASGASGASGPGRESRGAPEGVRLAAQRLRCRHDPLREALPALVQAASLGAALLAMAGRDAVRALFVTALPPLLTETAGSADRKGGFRPYALARLAVLGGLFAWGQSPGQPDRQALEEHIEFLVGPGPHLPLWTTASAGQAYVIAFTSFVVGHAPVWLSELGDQSLVRLSRCLADIGARNLAWAVLDCGSGPNAAASVELVLG